MFNRQCFEIFLLLIIYILLSVSVIFQTSCDVMHLAQFMLFMHVHVCIYNLLYQQESNNASASSWSPINFNAPNDIAPFAVELSYQMVSDVTSLFPRRLWRCRTEVSCASPTEVLSRLLRERHLWDDDVVKWRVVQQLDDNSDVFHYLTSPFYDITSWGLAYDRAAVDFCELR